MSLRSTQSSMSGLGTALASEKKPYTRGGGGSGSSGGLLVPPHLIIPSHPYPGGGIPSSMGTPTAANTSGISLGGNSSVGHPSTGGLGLGQGLAQGQGLGPTTPVGVGVSNGAPPVSLAVENHVVLTPLDFIPGNNTTVPVNTSYQPTLSTHTNNNPLFPAPYQHRRASEAVPRARPAAFHEGLLECTLHLSTHPALSTYLNITAPPSLTPFPLNPACQPT